jgi:hypothetical protein
MYHGSVNCCSDNIKLQGPGGMCKHMWLPTIDAALKVILTVHALHCLHILPNSYCTADTQHCSTAHLQSCMHLIILTNRAKHLTRIHKAPPRLSSQAKPHPCHPGHPCSLLRSIVSWHYIQCAVMRSTWQLLMPITPSYPTHRAPAGSTI